jgi:hypothetical protein
VPDLNRALKKVKTWQWTCPYCDWRTWGPKDLCIWTAEYHLADACPKVER